MHRLHHTIKFTQHKRHLANTEFKEKVAHLLPEVTREKLYGEIYGKFLVKFPPFSDTYIKPTQPAIMARFRWRLANVAIATKEMKQKRVANP